MKNGFIAAVAIGVCAVGTAQAQNDPPSAGDQTATDAAEIPITDLLNRLSQRGYAQYQQVERLGDVYIVRAMTTDLRPVTLELNTVTGEIQEVR